MIDWVVSKGGDIAGREMGVLTRACWRGSGGGDVCRLQAIDCQLMARRMQRAHDARWSQTTDDRRTQSRRFMQGRLSKPCG